MSSQKLTISGVEAACIYDSICLQLEYLEHDLQNPNIPIQEKSEILASIKVCQDILDKLQIPNVGYNFHE